MQRCTTFIELYIFLESDFSTLIILIFSSHLCEIVRYSYQFITAGNINHAYFPLKISCRDVSSIWVQLKPYLRWNDAVEQPEVTWPEVTWPEGTSVTWRDVTSITCPVRKYVLHMRNRKLRNIRPIVAFWPEVTSITWPEEALSGNVPVRKYVLRMPCFFPRFFLCSSNMATGCDRRSLDPFGVPLDVRMRNRKLRKTRSDRWSRDPFGSVPGVFSTTFASYDHSKHHVLCLTWWLELALVICPFYLSIDLWYFQP